MPCKVKIKIQFFTPEFLRKKLLSYLSTFEVICEGECKTFRECDNPRPWKNNRIIRNGLIKCKTCLGLWNRDTNASRNILHIVKNEIMRDLRRTKSSISGNTSVSD